jgi:hypothetical protein
VPPSRAQRTRTAERRRKAVDLRLAGVGWEQIAETLEYSGKASACKDVTRAMEAAIAAADQSVAVAKETELARLDRLQRGLWPAAVAGDPKSAAVVLQIHDRRVKLQRLGGDEEEQLLAQQQIAVRLSGQMAVVFARILDGLDLSARQRELVPVLLQEAVGGFLAAAAARTREIEAEVVE